MLRLIFAHPLAKIRHYIDSINCSNSKIEVIVSVGSEPVGDEKWELKAPSRVVEPVSRHFAKSVTQVD
jgi:hypothetical protein